MHKNEIEKKRDEVLKVVLSPESDSKTKMAGLYALAFLNDKESGADGRMFRNMLDRRIP